MLEQVPPDTQVVVVNDEGQVEPLASVEAAEVLVTGDPGVVPGQRCTNTWRTAVREVIEIWRVWSLTLGHAAYTPRSRRTGADLGGNSVMQATTTVKLISIQSHDHGRLD